MPKLVLIFLIFSLFILKIEASISPEEMIKNFDIRSYTPQKLGMKDLVVNIKVLGLQEKINKSGNLGKINNLFFTLYWTFPDKLKIVTNGLSPKLQDLQAALSAEVAGHIGYLIPQDLEKILKGMKVKSDEEVENQVIATDGTGRLSQNQINIIFDKQGVLNSMLSFGMSGQEKAIYEYKLHSWSNNKYVLTGLSIEKPLNGLILKSNTKINYMNKDGFGVPEKIVTASETDQAGKISKLPQVELMFSNYKINTGEAAKEIMKYNSGQNEK